MLIGSTHHFDVVLISAQFSFTVDTMLHHHQILDAQNDKLTLCLSLWKLINILDLTVEIWACMCSQDTESLSSVSCVFRLHYSVNMMLWICFWLNFTSNPWLLYHKFEESCYLPALLIHKDMAGLRGFNLLWSIKAKVCKNMTLVFQSVIYFMKVALAMRHL